MAVENESLIDGRGGVVVSTGDVLDDNEKHEELGVTDITYRYGKSPPLTGLSTTTTEIGQILTMFWLLFQRARKQLGVSDSRSEFNEVLPRVPIENIPS